MGAPIGVSQSFQSYQKPRIELMQNVLLQHGIGPALRPARTAPARISAMAWFVGLQ